MTSDKKRFQTAWLVVLFLAVGVAALVTGIRIAGATAESALAEELDDGMPAPSLWYSPLEIHFGAVPIGGSARRTVAVRNIGNAPLEMAGGAVGQPFAVDLSQCVGGVPGGGTCQIAYTFSPRNAGDYMTESAGDSSIAPWRVVLRGRAEAPELQVSPRSLDFGRGPVGGDFPSQIVNVTNIGSFPIGGFRAEPIQEPFTGGLGACSTTLQPGQSCHMTFDFVPESAGVFRKTWTVNSDAGPFDIELQGRTYSGISGTGQGVTPQGIDFGPVLLGTTVRQTVTFKNFDPFIPIVGWTYEWFSDDPAIDFDYRDNCGEVLAGLEECELTISYRPRYLERDYAILNVLNSQGIVDIELWGQGAGAEIVADSPAIDLGAPDVGRMAEQVVRFTNIGRATAALLGLQSTTSFSITDSNCGETLAAGESCQASILFEPHGYGRYEETVALLTDHDPVQVQVSGGTGTPSLALAFLPDSINRDDQTVLRLSLANHNTTQTLFVVGVDAVLPAGLEVSGAEPSYSPDCGLPVVIGDPGGTSISADDATIAAGKTCVIDIPIRAVLSGVHRFTAAAHSAAGPSAPVTAEVRVEAVDDLTIQMFVPSAFGMP